jgi:hypothetical protein
VVLWLLCACAVLILSHAATNTGSYCCTAALVGVLPGCSAAGELILNPDSAADRFSQFVEFANETSVTFEGASAKYDVQTTGEHILVSERRNSGATRTTRTTNLSRSSCSLSCCFAATCSALLLRSSRCATRTWPP